jgi:D-alanyl-D-alanine carboxypeptidase
MTKRARELGMTRTSFRNASGLPNRGQISTARDMATLAAALIRDYPKHYELFSTPEFTYQGTTYRNHNRLLRYYEGTDGIKTGYIRASGFNLVASAVRDGRRLIAVVFGGKSPKARDRQIARLMDTAFAQTQTAVAGVAKTPAPPGTKPAIVGPELVVDVAAADAAAPEPAEIGEGDASDIGAGDDAGVDLAWGVQVGAFYRSDSAKRAALAAADRAPEALGEARVMVSIIKGQRGDIFRARLIGLSESGARNACKQLKSAKADCLVVQVAQGTPTGKRIATN